MPASFTIAYLSAEDMPEIAAEWDRLFAADPESHFFLSRRFLEPIFAIHPQTGAFVCLKDDMPVGFFPVSVNTQWDNARSCFRTEYRMAGSKHWADYTGILIDPEVEDAVLDAYALHFRQTEWGHIRFKNLRMSERRQKRFFDHFEEEFYAITDREKIINGGTTNNLICPVITLPEDFDTYIGALSKNNRKSMRKFLRRVDDGEYAVRDGTVADLPEFERMWLEQWGTKSNGETLARKYANTVRIGLQQGTVHMPVLSEPDGRILGMICNFHDEVNRDIGCFVSARDGGAGSVPVALILHGHCIRRAIEQGYRTYDFLRGDEQYKFDMGAEPRVIRYPVLRRRSAAPVQALLSPLSARAVLMDIPELSGALKNPRVRAACAQLSGFF